MTRKFCTVVATDVQLCDTTSKLSPLFVKWNWNIPSTVLKSTLPEVVTSTWVVIMVSWVNSWTDERFVTRTVHILLFFSVLILPNPNCEINNAVCQCKNNCSNAPPSSFVNNLVSIIATHRLQKLPLFFITRLQSSCKWLRHHFFFVFKS